MSPPPPSGNSLRHIAVIMDGNGRWAQARKQPRTAGHREGLNAVRRLIENVITADVPYLTLFAFSNENWKRPQTEVKTLLSLFSRALVSESAALKKNGICLKIIGDLSQFSAALAAGARRLENYTKNGARLQLTLALGYSGKWDILQAAQKITADAATTPAPKKTKAGQGGQPSPASPFTEEEFTRRLSTADLPPPDLLIRTGGEHRISNFMLWQMAYTELYFTNTLWPDFAQADLQQAIDDFHRRERRFGMLPAAPATPPPPKK